MYLGAIKNNVSGGFWRPLKADNLFKAKVEMTHLYEPRASENDKIMIAKFSDDKLIRLCMREAQDIKNKWRILEGT